MGGVTRFEFARNWELFNRSVSPRQRDAARESLHEWLGDLMGLTFLDIGAGSGVFSAAADELGADVRAFDYEPASGAIERGDVLDADFMRSLGLFDVVYAWGVLHHTGRMWEALANAAAAVAPGGRLFFSIYNDQEWRSRVWRRMKLGYNRLPRALRPVYVGAVLLPREVRALVKSLLSGKNYVATWRHVDSRGMRKWRDMVDWVGGYPFEVAKPEDVLAFCRERGFVLERMKTVGGRPGCNEFLFRRADS